MPIGETQHFIINPFSDIIMSLSPKNKELLEKEKNRPWMTPGTVTILGNMVNLHTASLDDLHQVVFFLEAMEKGYRSIPSYVPITAFKICGFPYSAWMNDLSKKIAIIRLQNDE
jgi:hypothetical protein